MRFQIIDLPKREDICKRFLLCMLIPTNASTQWICRRESIILSLAVSEVVQLILYYITLKVTYQL